MPVRSSQEDFLLRELRKVAAMIARAMGFRANGDFPAARAEIKNAYATLLGSQSELLRILDPVSAARLVGEPKRLVALVRLTFAEAELAASERNQQLQSGLNARARILLEEAVKLHPTDEEAAAALEELRDK